MNNDIIQNILLNIFHYVFALCWIWNIYFLQKLFSNCFFPVMETNSFRQQHSFRMILIKSSIFRNTASRRSLLFMFLFWTNPKIRLEKPICLKLDLIGKEHSDLNIWLEGTHSPSNHLLLRLLKQRNILNSIDSWTLTSTWDLTINKIICKCTNTARPQDISF